jgi:hypothetical protein
MLKNSQQKAPLLRRIYADALKTHGWQPPSRKIIALSAKQVFSAMRL